MQGRNKSNAGVPVFVDPKLLQYPDNASNQLPLFGNGRNYATAPIGCNVDNVNYIGGEHNSPIFRPNKRGREAAAITRQQMVQISLNHNICHDETDRTASNPIQNPVSTGLKLSYEDDERNSSITSANGSATVAQSVFLSLGENFRTELDRQKEEFDQYIKTQEENLVKGVRDIKQRHIDSFLIAIEKGVHKKIHEKEIEIENINHKNKELAERIKQVATEAQNWHYRAKYNDSVVNFLKTNLQHALSMGAEQTKEGFGDSEIDDTASCVDPNNYLRVMGGARKDNNSSMICRVCKVKEVRVLLMPCRHLCLCKDCEGLVAVCPVCQLMKTASVQVYLS